jgi:uncharacterized protein YndB with AHSA1/START domain
MTEPLVVEFAVAAPPAHAFEVWTNRVATWWPDSHTLSGDPASITFEPGPGGRIVEVAADGARHEWGEVLEWDPPRRLRFLWHLFFDREEATEVEVRFLDDRGGTLVRLEQTGWDRLGTAGPPRRDRTRGAWTSIMAHYAAATAAGWAAEPGVG